MVHPSTSMNMFTYKPNLQIKLFNGLIELLLSLSRLFNDWYKIFGYYQSKIEHTGRLQEETIK